MEHEDYMREALSLAREAAQEGEVPVGCVIVNARIPRVYYGARDEAMGACGGVLNLFMERFPFRPALVGGILKDECRTVLADFFRTLRS